MVSYKTQLNWHQRLRSIGPTTLEPPTHLSLVISYGTILQIHEDSSTDKKNQDSTKYQDISTNKNSTLPTSHTLKICQE